MDSIHDDWPLGDDRADYEAWCIATEEDEWWALQEAQALDELEAGRVPVAYRPGKEGAA